MSEIVNVDEEAIEILRDALQTTGEEYKYNLNRLENIIKGITEEDIKGTPATRLLDNYKKQEESFKKMADAITKAEEYINSEKKEFNNMVDELSEEMVKAND